MGNREVMRKTLSCTFFFVVALASMAQAQRQGVVRDTRGLPFASVDTRDGLESTIQYVMPNADLGFRNQALEALVGSSVDPLDWPQLPRVWWKFDTYESESTNTYIGFNWSYGKLSGGAKHNFAARYSRSVGLVLVGSLRAKDQIHQNQASVGLAKAGEVAAPPMVIEDPTSGILYPNVRQGFPMVAMCVYELSMASEETKGFSFDFFGSGHNQEGTKGFGTPYTLYSNFFQLDPDKAILSYYLKDHCNKMFESAAKNWVEKQFIAAHRSYRTETHSDCLRERYGTDRSVGGDKSCLNWHHEFPEQIQNSTVARCERGEDDLFHCQLRSRDAGSTCPMRQNREAKFLPSLNLGSLSLRSFPCDGAANLECVPSLPQENIKNLESNRLFLSTDQWAVMGTCQSVRSSSR